MRLFPGVSLLLLLLCLAVASFASGEDLLQVPKEGKLNLPDAGELDCVGPSGAAE